VAGVAGLLESLAAGLVELVLEAAGVVPLGLVWCFFTGFLESVVAAGAELELFEVAGEVAGAGVAGAGVCAAIKLAAARIVKIRGFISRSPSRNRR
jgi:hypothetical protein